MQKKIYIVPFIIIEAVLLWLVLFQSGDISSSAAFALVVCAFLFSLLSLREKEKNCLVPCALFFTVCADGWLVLGAPLTNFKQSMGMSFFIVAQLFYFLRLLQDNPKSKLNKINIWIRLPLVVIVETVTLLVLKEKTDYLSVVSMAYYVNLILNVIFAFIQFKKSPFLAVGFFFFLLCDTTIGLHFLADNIFSFPPEHIISKFLAIPFNFTWATYGPSQVLLALSTTSNK